MIGKIEYLSGGNDSLELKQRTFKFTDKANKPDMNNDKMVTKKEMETFLNKNLKPEKNKGSKKVIRTIIKFFYGKKPKNEIDANKANSMLKNGITIKNPYDDNSAFMKNTLSK